MRNSIGYFQDQSDDDDFDEECWNSKFTLLKVYDDDEYVVPDNCSNSIPDVLPTVQRYYKLDELFRNNDINQTAVSINADEMMGITLSEYSNLILISDIDYSNIYDQYAQFDSQNLMTEDEYALFKKNHAPTDKLMTCKYLLFKIVNSKNNKYNMTSKSEFLCGEFLTSEIFMKKEVWNTTCEECDSLTRLNAFLSNEVVLKLTKKQSLQFMEINQQVNQLKQQIIGCQSFLSDFSGLKKLFEMVCCMTNYAIYLKTQYNINMDMHSGEHDTFDALSRLLSFVKKYILFSILKLIQNRMISSLK